MESKAEDCDIGAVESREKVIETPHILKRNSPISDNEDGIFNNKPSSIELRDTSANELATMPTASKRRKSGIAESKIDFLGQSMSTVGRATQSDYENDSKVGIIESCTAILASTSSPVMHKNGISENEDSKIGLSLLESSPPPHSDNEDSKGGIIELCETVFEPISPTQYRISYDKDSKTVFVPFDYTEQIESNWPSCWTLEQKNEFCRKYEWLSIENKKLGCTPCKLAGARGIMRVSKEWANNEINYFGDTRKTQLTALRKKVYDHKESSSHKAALQLIGGINEQKLKKIPNYKMDKDMKGWFTELSPMWPGQAFSLKVKEVFVNKKSKFQDIKVFESTNHGRVLVLDGMIQCTERDEAAYQEMGTFLPLNSHPNPEKVLVVGGGDGGILRELAKHPKVKEIYHCDIDEEVIEACKTYIPSMGCGFSNPIVKSFTGDGAAFVENTTEKFDIIITDASDPVVAGDTEEVEREAPAKSLFNHEYYGKMKQKLKPGGILCCQGENMWLHGTLIARLMNICRKDYPVVEYAYTCVPTYPGGQIGFILCSLNEETNFREPLTKWNDEEVEKYSLKYYCEEIHKASFVLPPFMKKQLR